MSEDSEEDVSVVLLVARGDGIGHPTHLILPVLPFLVSVIELLGRHLVVDASIELGNPKTASMITNSVCCEGSIFKDQFSNQVLEVVRVRNASVDELFLIVGKTVILVLFCAFPGPQNDVRLCFARHLDFS